MAPSNKPTSNLFLTRNDLENVRKWEYKVSDGSLTTLLLNPFWVWLAKFIPASIAPNVITLAGFICQLLAFWVSDPSIVQWIGSKTSAVSAAVFTYSYMTLDALDGKHARATKQSGPLGEIFDHACDNIGGAFSAIAFMRILASFEGIESFAHPAVMWYGVQAYCIAFLLCHLFAFDHPERKIIFKSLNGPGEMLHVMMWIMLLRAFLPNAFVAAFSYISKLSPIYDFIPWVEKHIQLSAVDLVYNSVRVLFLLVLAFALISVLRMRSEFLLSKIILFSIFAIRMVPSILMSMKFGTVADSAGPSITQIVGDGLYLAVLTSDLIIAKIANRQVHALLPVIALASIISHHVSIVAAFIYHITILYDLCSYLQRPLLSPVRRVYCDGVFDLLHVGHMAQFRKALEVTDGDYLLVGVMNDQDCVKYKRKPVMSETERYEAVANCAFVNEVVRDAPEKITDELLIKHRIDVVAAGEEYEDINALVAAGKYDYYSVPRSKKMLKFTSRTPGISTSDIIKRIHSRHDLHPVAAASAERAGAKKEN